MAKQFTDLESFYSTTLAQSITASQTSIPVASAPASVTDAFLVIEKNTANEEIVKMTARSSTTLTVVRGLAVSGSTETDAGNGISHPAGASIELVNVHYYLKQIQSANIWSYRGDYADLTTIQALSDNVEAGDVAIARDTGYVYYYNGSSWAVIAGGTTPSDASTSTKGISKMSVAPASASNPIAVGDNDPRVPTTDENDALAGSSGTPSSSNKYLTEDDDATTSTASKLIRADANGKIDSSWFSGIKFGGDGSDGALDTSGGAVDIDCGASAVVIKQYTSINVASSNLTFSNPHASGTIVILKSQGNVVISASIDISGIGASASTDHEGFYLDTATVDHSGGDGSTYNTVGSAGSTSSELLNWYAVKNTLNPFHKLFMVMAGSGGGNGGSGGEAGGAGGRGGGGLYIECGGAWNFTGTIDASGDDASNGTDSPDSTGGDSAGGGGGGGSAGTVLVLYNTLTASSGTITVDGGDGGNGGSGNETQRNQASGAGGGGASMLDVAGGAGGSGTNANGNQQANGGGGSNGEGTGGSAGTKGTGTYEAGGGGGGGAGGYYAVLENVYFA